MPIKSRQRGRARQLGGVARRIVFQARGDALERGHGRHRLVRGQGELGQEDRGGQLGHHLALPAREHSPEVVDLAGADGRGCEQHAETLRVPQRVLAQWSGIEEDLGRPVRRQNGVAKRLVNAHLRKAAFLPDPLELDQIGDHARSDLVDRSFIDLAADSNRAASLVGTGRHDRRSGPEGIVNGPEAELGQVVIGGQPRDLHRLLEPFQGQDRQVRSRCACRRAGPLG